VFFCGPTAISKALHTKSNEYSTPNGTRFFFGKGEFYFRSPALDRPGLHPRSSGWPGPCRSLIPTLGDREWINQLWALFLSPSPMRPDVDTKYADADFPFCRELLNLAGYRNRPLRHFLPLLWVRSCPAYHTIPLFCLILAWVVASSRDAHFAHPPWCGGKVVDCPTGFSPIRFACSPAPFLSKFR